MQTINGKRIIPIVFALDDNYVPFLSVSIKSILDNASSDNFYKFFVFNVGFKEDSKRRLSVYNTDISGIEFVDVSKCIEQISSKVCLRDYYSKATYYRFFIPKILSDYDKVIYIDSDTVLLKDIAGLYNQDIGDSVFGAIPDESVQIIKPFSDYTQEYLGVEGFKYFNAGVLLINVNSFNKNKIYEKFLDLLSNGVMFEVAQDQDYLNVLSYGKVKFIDRGWNKMPMGELPFKEEDIKLIHYNLSYKPWHFDGILYEKYFWDVAKTTDYYSEILQIKSNFSEEDKLKDESYSKHLMSLVVEKYNLAKSGKNEYRGYIDAVRTKD